MNVYDVIIIGAGAAGLSAAMIATNNKKRVLILDMGNAPARKVAVSGGGRCNITNAAVAYTRYFGTNPNFVRGAIARVSPNDILDWMNKHDIEYTEKTPGQYFCKTTAIDVVNALLSDSHGAEIKYNHTVSGVQKENDLFIIYANDKKFSAKNLIVATGGTSFATLGVSDIGHKIAKHFGHKIVPVRPALCAIATNLFSSDLAGISTHVQIIIGKEKFNDDLLFTHFGIGGPATYRATVRDMTNGFTINMCPDVNMYDIMRSAKQKNGKRTITNIVSEFLPLRLARFLTNNDNRNIADIKDTEIKIVADKINAYKIDYKNIKLHNLQSAEVVRGGISTDDVSSKTMESKLCPGLFFAGEVLDIAGDLGGFNLHWAWASGRVAGQSIH